MAKIGDRIAFLRKAKGISQQKLANELSTSHSVIGRYERDEMKPSKEEAQKIDGFLNTTVGYLPGETEDAELFKNPSMVLRLKELNSLPEKDKDYILYALDELLQNVKAIKAFAWSWNKLR